MKIRSRIFFFISITYRISDNAIIPWYNFNVTDIRLTLYNDFSQTAAHIESPNMCAYIPIHTPEYNTPSIYDHA